jgi:hypothetical protein
MTSSTFWTRGARDAIAKTTVSERHDTMGATPDIVTGHGTAADANAQLCSGLPRSWR